MRAAGSRLVILAVGWLLACSPAEPAATWRARKPPDDVSSPACSALRDFVQESRPRYAAAVSRARTFLDGLDVDPRRLRERGLKGKKKLVEALDAYTVLYRISPPAERPAILARIVEIARPTTENSYHDMLSIDDREFHEDATSYLRAALLLDHLGLDVRRYVAEIAAIKPRLDRHMASRGAHQRRAFHYYYQHFGLPEPFPLGASLGDGLIARRALDGLSRADVYALTHEIYAAYDFGDARDANPFGSDDRDYLRRTLPGILRTWLERGDVDLAAELSTCMSFLGFADDPIYARALGALLTEQNPDGSWGRYEAARARLGDLVKQGLYLHTTMVSVEALALGFEDAHRGAEGACRTGPAPERRR